MDIKEGLSLKKHIILIIAVLISLFICISLGSVSIPIKETINIIWGLLLGKEPYGMYADILIHVRLPRVLSVMPVGAALSLAGAAMQGIIRNPLADGSTLGTSSGAALGAVIALSLGVWLPSFPVAGTVVFAIVFSFISLIIVLSLSYAVDKLLSNNTIILMGVIFSMFTSSFISLIMAFSGERLRSITFWTMGSLAGSNFNNVLLLLITLIIAGSALMLNARELNAFSLGEDEAMHIGVDVKKTKLIILVSVSFLIGVSVSVGGSIGFVGLIVPHTCRLLFGGNHFKLLPSCVYVGAIFLLFMDLIARTLVSPVELPIGVVTSFIGAISFVIIYYRRRKHAGT
ncbi:MAG: iron ABC transporter permease [Christensenellaceae bacterium]|nr:iron ABC transporter permease [Christensenellaceae bacterium]